MRIKCGGYWSHSFDGSEFDCEYKTGIYCDDCIINGGHLSPVSGKEFRGNREPYIKAYLARNGCDPLPPLETTKCYNCVDEGDMDFGKLAEIIENLPCAIGTRVYKIYSMHEEKSNCNDAADGCEFYNINTGICENTTYENRLTNKGYILADKFCYEHIAFFGKTIFLTRKDAEQALHEGNTP